MRLPCVFLICFLFSCAVAFNYKGCQSFSGGSFIPAPGPLNAKVSECQSLCAGAGQSVGNIGISSSGSLCLCSFTGVATAESNCPVVCTGATATQGTHCGSGSLTSSVYALVCIGICDDPHFTGLDGSRYDYTASADRVVALISDRIVQVNAFFVSYADKSVTLLGQVGVRVCDHTVELYMNGTVVLDRKAPLSVTSKASATLSPALTVTRTSQDTVRIHAGNWRMSMQMLGDHVNIGGIVHLDANDTFVHGAYGITGHPDHHQLKKELCQPVNEGGCELPGKWEDYELPVGADLCSTAWTYSQFNAAQCASLGDKAAKLQDLESARKCVRN